MYGLSEVIDAAIKRELRGANSPRKQQTFEQSCCAVYRANDRLHRDKQFWAECLDNTFDECVEEMGLTEPMMFNAFDEFPKGCKRQQARALWLTWVKLMLEEDEV